MDEKEAAATSNSAETSQDEAFLTLGGRHRANRVEIIRPPHAPTLDSLIHTADTDTPYTKEHRAIVKERLNAIENPITRRELRQQERETYKKEHPVKHLGYRALYRLLKPFSK